MRWKKVKPLLLGLGLAGLGVSAYALLLRPRHLRWGATDEEAEMRLPGDEFISKPQVDATHAITINAPPAYLWPWLVQIGQRRGGFYSYTWLENLVGCQMRNADRIHPEWQELRVGDEVWLHPKAPPLKVLAIAEQHYIVLERCWSFHLLSIGENQTRLIIRGRGEFNPDFHNRLLNLIYWRGIFEPAHFIMERKMMLTLKQLAENFYAQEKVIAKTDA